MKNYTSLMPSPHTDYMKFTSDVRGGGMGGLGGMGGNVQRNGKVSQEFKVKLGMDEIFNGCEKSIEIPIDDMCGECDGTGSKSKKKKTEVYEKK